MISIAINTSHVPKIAMFLKSAITKTIGWVLNVRYRKIAARIRTITTPMLN